MPYIMAALLPLIIISGVVTIIVKIKIVRLAKLIDLSPPMTIAASHSKTLKIMQSFAVCYHD